MPGQQTTLPPSNTETSHSPLSASFDMDLKPSASSPMARLHSPAFDFSQPVSDSSLQPPNGHASAPHGVSPSMSTSMATLQLDFNAEAQRDLQIRTSLASSPSSLQSATLQQAINASAAMLQTSPFAFSLPASQSFSDNSQLAFASSFDMPLHSSPTQEYMPTSQSQMQPNLDTFIMNNSMAQMAPIESLSSPTHQFSSQELMQMVADSWQAGSVIPMSSAYVDPTMAQNNPDNQDFMASRSYSSDNSWIYVPDNGSGRTSLDGFSDSSNVVSPQILHVRADSNSSDNTPSTGSVHSFDDAEIFHVSPEPESRAQTTYTSTRNSPEHGLASYPPIRSVPVAPTSTPAGPLAQSPSSSPPSSSSPKSKQRKTSPSTNTPKTISKKKTSPTSSIKGDKSEKRIGRRRGPLKPEQRQSAHEIRKLRACIRCKFLKKVCDKGDPCTGCQPSHARLWQVPCTRIDIKDIGFFLKDWNVDYERHVTLGFSIENIKSFGTQEQLIYITHGYGYCLPIWARRVYVHNEDCFDADWIETTNDDRAFELPTNHLSAGADGVSKTVVSEYVDMHFDNGFDNFIKGYFDDTPFLCELLRTIYQYYLATKQQNIRKGLKLVIAYALTLHITLVHGLPEDEAEIGKIEDPTSRYYGQTCAPVMINFQVKRAMANLWRDLMKEVLEDLSALYSSVYNGEKLKNWPTIFMLAALILSVWEMVQFDSHYRMQDEALSTKFCNEMEHIPVGVIVGLFGAISTKLPTFLEWDTEKHGSAWSGNTAVCDTMTAVRSHVEKHGE
jgi:hypothetical protein